MFKDKDESTDTAEGVSARADNTDNLDQAIEVAEEFVKSATDLRKRMSGGEAKKIHVRRCKRTSMSLSDELIELRRSMN